MIRPAFFDDVRKIALRDPLAEFLGAAEGGVIEYGCLDAVSSPATPAHGRRCLSHDAQGAHASLRDELPERGAVRVLSATT